MVSTLRFVPSPPVYYPALLQSPPVVILINPLSLPPSTILLGPRLRSGNDYIAARYRSSSVHGSLPEPQDAGGDGDDITFDRAVSLFNGADYHRCHDLLEELWYVAEEPIRTLLHGLLQCAVGFHHLFNQNHRGAMMELGEGLCKLRKMDFESGPFYRFEKEVSEVLEFVYRTQMELAACADDLCVAMDGSERSYQLLGSFAAGQRLYTLSIGSDSIPYIVFCPSYNSTADKILRVRLPTLSASEEHLKAYDLAAGVDPDYAEEEAPFQH